MALTRQLMCSNPDSSPTQMGELTLYFMVESLAITEGKRKQGPQNAQK